MQHCSVEHPVQLAADCLSEHPEQGGLAESKEFARGRKPPYCWMMTTSGVGVLTFMSTALVGEIM